MSSRTIVSVIVLALGACARHTMPPVVLTPQTRIGPAEDFGVGIVDATPKWVKFDFNLPAYVIGFRMTDDGGIQQWWNSAKLGRGTHTVRARSFRGRSPLLNDDGYWLVIVSDAPTPPAIFDQRLESIMLADPPLRDALHSLPVVLVASRTGHWAAYYTTFGTPVDP
jgi:hypothetical protein